MTDPESALVLEHLSKIFVTSDGNLEALKDVNLEVLEGEFVTVVGPSGCGKSTILTLVAGLAAPSNGTITLHGARVRGPSPAVGFISQRDNLLPWRTVSGNVEIGLEIAGIASAERRERARAIVDRVGLSGFEDRYPHELSGGMRQRVNIARTLVRDPGVILMDEPFGSLDALTRGHLQMQVLSLWRETRKTIIFVTHDLVEAIALGDHIVVISARPGRVKAVVDVPLPRPRDVFQVHRQPGFEECHAAVWAQLADELPQLGLAPREGSTSAAPSIPRPVEAGR